MASVDRLQLYSDKYPEVSRELLRDLNRIFDELHKTQADHEARIAALEAARITLDGQVASILARLLAAGIP